MKKITTILILALTSLFANAQDIQMAPGSMLSIYQLQQGQSFWNPGQEPINTVIDRTQSFNACEALKMNNETKQLINLLYLGVAWSGFIEIKEAGVYVFSLQDNYNPNFDRKASVYINNKPYLVSEFNNSNKNPSATKTLKLDPGFYKIDLVRVHLNQNILSGFYHGGGVTPTLTYWNKLQPTVKTAITPATLMLKRK